MNYKALWEEIQDNPNLVPYIHTNDMPKISTDEAYAKDATIAAILSAGRTKIVRAEVNDGVIALALGIPAGPVFLLQLEQRANSEPPVDSSPAQIASFAVARQVWRSLARGSLDLGHPAVRAGIDMFVGDLLDSDQAEAIKQLAVVDEVITAADVSKAVRGPRE